MNCSKCRSGVLESIGILKFVDGEMKVTVSDVNREIGIQILVCSKEQCGHTTMLATPGTLSTAKQIMRKRNLLPVFN